jgi:hypothetical protein
MPEMSKVPPGQLEPAQAADLARLVDLEACWENLRKGSPPGHAAVRLSQDLKDKQKAYDAFHDRLVAYNKRYTPAHVAELLLNTPPRLAAWCRTMRDLYRQVEQAPEGHCPVSLLEKAHRWADRVAARLNKDRAGPSTSPGTIAAAIRDLEALAQWCDGLRWPTLGVSGRTPLAANQRGPQGPENAPNC